MWKTSLEPTANNDDNVINVKDNNDSTMDVDNYANEITSADNDGRSDDGPTVLCTMKYTFPKPKGLQQHVKK